MGLLSVEWAGGVHLPVAHPLFMDALNKDSAPKRKAEEEAQLTSKDNDRTAGHKGR